MSTLAKSLARLYRAGKVTLDKLGALRAEGKITQEEFEQITTEN